MNKYIIAIDQGTTSTLIILVNKNGEIVDKDLIKVAQTTSSRGEILQNPEELYKSVEVLINRLINRNNLTATNIDSIGITNQRETTVIWNKYTGKSIYNAISWQSTHTESITKSWVDKGYSELVLKKTGLTIHPYFSASKIKFILDQTKEDVDNLLFGTIDTYLLWRLTKGESFYTDVTNASRTMLYNIREKSWDMELLELFGIPEIILPPVKSNDFLFGHYEFNGVMIPIRAMIGDQQSALFGHQCFKVGETKITYGTGCFILLNIGSNINISKNGLITTIAWDINNKTSYALEGSVFMGGAAVQWMRDKLHLINHASETEQMAYDSKDNDVFVVPAFVGLGTPYWDYDVKGSILGLKASTTKDDIMKATLNSIAYQVTDVLGVMLSEANITIKSIAVDGGASNNNYLMQYQADLINKELIQNMESEMTALGAAYIAGLASGFWNDISDLKNHQKIKQLFIPNNDRTSVINDYKMWELAVKATRMFKNK